MIKTLNDLSRTENQKNILKSYSTKQLSYIKLNNINLSSERKKKLIHLELKEKRNNLENLSDEYIEKINYSPLKPSLNANNFNLYKLQSINKSSLISKNKKKRMFKSKKLENDLLISLENNPTIFKMNNKLLNDGIFKKKYEIKYSKKNKENISDYFYKRDNINEQKILIHNDLFEKKKKNLIVYPIKSDFKIKPLKEDKEFNLIHKKYKEYQRIKIIKNSINFGNQIKELFETENIFNNKEKPKSKSIPNKKRIFNNLHKKIKIKKQFFYKTYIYDTDLNEIDDNNINNSGNSNYIQYKRYNCKYPRFLKTKFKRSTILKFGAFGGFFDEKFV